jgi:hypothetical protein
MVKWHSSENKLFAVDWLMCFTYSDAINQNISRGHHIIFTNIKYHVNKSPINALNRREMHKLFCRKHEGRRPFGRPRRRWEEWAGFIWLRKQTSGMLL